MNRSAPLSPWTLAPRLALPRIGQWSLLVLPGGQLAADGAAAPLK